MTPPTSSSCVSAASTLRRVPETGAADQATAPTKAAAMAAALVLAMATAAVVIGKAAVVIGKAAVVIGKAAVVIGKGAVVISLAAVVVAVAVVAIVVEDTTSPSPARDRPTFLQNSRPCARVSGPPHRATTPTKDGARSATGDAVCLAD